MNRAALIRGPGLVLILCALATAGLGVYAASVPGELELGSGEIAGTPSQRAADALAAELRFDPVADFVLVAESAQFLNRDTAGVAIRALRSQIGALESVGRAGKAVSSPSGARSIAVYLKPGTDTAAAIEVGEALREDLDPGPLELAVAGDVAVSEAAREQLLDEAPGLALLALPLLVVVLALTLGARLGLLALLGALLAAVAALAAVGLADAVSPMYSAAVPVALAGGFGGAILLACSIELRYREEAGSLGEGKEALRYSARIVARGAAAAPLGAALILLGALLVDVPVVTSIAAAALLGTLAALLGLVPAYGAIAAGLARSPRQPLPLVGEGSEAPGAPRSFGIALAIGRRRGRRLAALIPAVLLAAAAIPLFGSDVVGLDAPELAADDPVRVADAALAERFGAGDSSPIVVATPGPADAPEVEDQREQIAALEGVGRVSPPGNAGPFARYMVTPLSPPRSLDAQRTARLLGEVESADAPRLSGPTATLRDLRSRLGSRLPVAGAVALLAVALLWVGLFRGLFAAGLALAAALGALAGAGILTLVFAGGALEGLLGYVDAGAPHVLVPLMAILVVGPFALFAAGQLGSALREERVLGGAAPGALARSSTLTLRPATVAAGCAALAAGVWLGSDLVIAKELALGIVAGLALTALLAQALIAPALARFLWR